MLKFQAGFLVIINRKSHVHREQTGQIVVSGHDHPEHLPEVLCHGYLHQAAGRDQCVIHGGYARHPAAAVEERVLPLTLQGAHEPFGKGVVDGIPPVVAVCKKLFPEVIHVIYRIVKQFAPGRVPGAFHRVDLASEHYDEFH